ncbi:MAG: rhomboid family intramembrane serine protease [Verrucomicrobia bacterium]|nr:rhomboid family intramembrane serine protease [Verrucomicrobiota bacterium]MDA1087879.1 rhomboid family intramembrane serine protease [Verrucomicrobiota bacterium]
MPLPRYSVYSPHGGGSNFFSLVSPTRTVKLLLIITIGAFLVQAIAERMWGAGLTRGILGLNIYFFKSGMLWQIGTYMFMHGGLWHLLSNMIGLFFFGPHIERAFGPRRFIQFYFAAGVAAGLGWLVIDLGAMMIFGSPHVPCIGASGAVLGIVAAFGTMYPRQQVTILFLFIPITMTARTLVIGYTVVTILMLVTDAQGSVAHSAHLFGLLTGYLYTKKFMENDARGRAPQDHGMIDDLLQRFRRRKFKIVVPESSRNAPSEKETNRILEKISQRGMRSLTREERRALEHASNNQDQV